jgi:type IV secretory pathway VirB2 component (pilin)
MTARKRTGWLAMPRVRRTLARILVVAGALLALLGLITARYGFLLAGILVVGLGAAFGPARIRPRD